MTHQSPDDVRHGLRFPSEVRKQFGFLEALGFKECESSATYVRYARAEFLIEIYHGRQSYELGLNLIRYGVSYSLQTLLGVHQRAGGTTSFQPFAATTQHGVAVGVGHLARMFASCIEYFLSGDRAVYQALDDYCNETSERFALDSLARQLRPEAEAAFRNKDYRLAAELYGRMREQLTPAEVVKLSFARSRS